MDNQIKENLGYHYTSIETLKSLLDGICDESIIFHASSVFYMNDPTEMKYGFNKMMDILPDIENELSVKEDIYKLSKLWDKSPQYKYEQWNNIYLNKIETYFNHPFVISFSKCRDELPMWAMYGVKGNGIALGFDIRLYLRELQPEDDIIKYDLTHINSNQQYAIDMEYGGIRPISFPYIWAKYEYSKYLKAVRIISNGERIFMKQLNALHDIMVRSAPFVKHNAYSYERESRWVSIDNNLHNIKFKTNAMGRITPYREVNIPISALKEIIIGPCCNSSRTDNCIEQMLKQKGIVDVEITESKVPYKN